MTKCAVRIWLAIVMIIAVSYCMDITGKRLAPATLLR